MSSDLKTCIKCARKLPVTDFHKAGNNKDGYKNRCKDCCNQYAREYRESRTPEQKLEVHRTRQLRLKYNLSLEEYNDMVESQNGTCAICGNPDPRRGLSVDHDHETGEIRLLLCSPCNQGLGYFKDDPFLLEKAAEYLRKFK